MTTTGFAARRGVLVAGLLTLGLSPAVALGAGPARLAASFDPTARLGASTAVQLQLRIDPRRAPSPLTDVRILYPAGLGIVSSGLGLAACRRPASDFREVVISGPPLGGCSPNAVLGYGAARAEVRFYDGEVIPEYAGLTLLSGPLTRGNLGLVVYVDGEHPFGAKLAYAGDLLAASTPFGGALAFRLPSIPALAGLAMVALTDLRLTIGSRAITYYQPVGRRSVAYHPEGVALPSRCPKQGFRFRAQLAFGDGSRTTANATVSCGRLRPRAAS